MSLLNNLRGASDDTKKHVSGIFATTITAVIAVVWFSTLPSRLESFAGTAPGQQEKEMATENSSPSLADLFSEAKNQVGAVGQSLPDAQKELEEAKKTFEETASKPKAVRIKTLSHSEEEVVDKEVEDLPRIRIAPASGTTVNQAQ